LHFEQAFTKLTPLAPDLAIGILFPGVFMSKKWPALVGLFVAAFLLVPLSACGHAQQLESITVIPTIETFGATNIPVNTDAGLNVQLRALGSYSHPPVTKDITTQVTWSSNTPDMVTVDAAGLITATGNSCGGTIISATVTINHSDGNIPSKGAIVTGSMQANVVCFTGR
jgi:Bacterial Ig-like domain (group 2)